MPNNTNNQPQPPTPNDKKTIIIGVVVVVFIVAALAFLLPQKTGELDDVKDQLDELARKSKLTSFERLIPQSVQTPEESELPVVDQAQLKQEYEKNLKNIIAELDQEIQTADGISQLDILTAQRIKEKVMQEVVPGEYKNLHVDLVFALDLMIEGNSDEAERKLGEVKNRI